MKFDPIATLKEQGLTPADVIFAGQSYPSSIPDHMQAFVSIVLIDPKLGPQDKYQNYAPGRDVYTFKGMNGRLGILAPTLARIAGACGIETRVIGCGPYHEPPLMVQHLGRDFDISSLSVQVVCEARVLEASGVHRSEVKSLIYSARSAFEQKLESLASRANGNPDWEKLGREAAAAITKEADNKWRGLETKCKNRAIRALLGWQAGFEPADLERTGGKICCVRYEYRITEKLLEVAFQARLGVSLANQRPTFGVLPEAPSLPQLPGILPHEEDALLGEYEAAPDPEDLYSQAEAAGRAAEEPAAPAAPAPAPAESVEDRCDRCDTPFKGPGERKSAEGNASQMGGRYCFRCMGAVVAERKAA